MSCSSSSRASGLRRSRPRLFLLRAVELPIRLHVIDAPGAQGIARWRLDLDHLGAKIAKNLGQRVPGDET